MMENKEYNEMTTEELWKEISSFIACGNYCEEDKKLFIKLIDEYKSRE